MKVDGKVLITIVYIKTNIISFHNLNNIKIYIKNCSVACIRFQTKDRRLPLNQWLPIWGVQYPWGFNVII